MGVPQIISLWRLQLLITTLVISTGPHSIQQRFDLPLTLYWSLFIEPL